MSLKDLVTMIVQMLLLATSFCTETSVTLYPVELLLVWQLPLELQLEEYCSAWRKAPLSGTRPSLGERYKSNSSNPTSLHVTILGELLVAINFCIY